MNTHAHIETIESEKRHHDVHRRIAYLATPVEFGGAERVSLTFLKHFQCKNTVLHPILLVRPWEKDENIFIKELRAREIPFSLVPTRIRQREQGSDHFRLLRAARIIYKEIEAGSFDLIHSNGYFADIAGAIAAKLLGIPIISTSHGFIFSSRKIAFYNMLDVYALRCMSAIVAVSSKIKDHLVSQGVDMKKIHVVENAVQQFHDEEWKKQWRQTIRHQYGVKENEILIGYVGRLSVEKGLEYLLGAASRLAQSNVLFRMLVIGDGPERNELEKLTKHKCLQNHVIFTGFLENPIQVLPALDIFALPSLTEGTSMALLEAMSCGVAVVATSVGGTPKVISTGVNGILLPPADSNAIYRETLRLIEDKDLRRKCGTEAEKTIENQFSLSSWMAKIDRIYANVIDNTHMSM